MSIIAGLYDEKHFDLLVEDIEDWNDIKKVMAYALSVYDDTDLDFLLPKVTGLKPDEYKYERFVDLCGRVAAMDDYPDFILRTEFCSIRTAFDCIERFPDCEKSGVSKERISYLYEELCKPVEGIDYSELLYVLGEDV